MKLPNQSIPVLRTRSAEFTTQGIQPSDIKCTICKAACGALSGIAKTLCLAACNATVC